MNQHVGFDWVWTFNAKDRVDEVFQDEKRKADLNEAAEELVPISEALEDMDYQYLVFRGERGAAQGGYHIQGFVQFDEMKPKKEVVKHFHERTGANWAKIAKRMGSPQEARDYVLKVNQYDPEVTGEPDTTWDVIPVVELGEFHEEDRHDRKRKPQPVKKATGCRTWNSHEFVNETLWSEIRQMPYDDKCNQYCTKCLLKLNFCNEGCYHAHRWPVTVDKPLPIKINPGPIFRIADINGAP